MRIALAALPALLIAAPVAAQVPPRGPDLSAADMAAQLENPVVQEGVSAALTALAGIVLDTRIGRLAHLLDPATDVPADATVGDVQRRSDPDFDRRLRDNTRRGVAVAGAAAGDMAATAGELARTADRLQRALGPLLDYSMQP